LPFTQTYWNYSCGVRAINPATLLAGAISSKRETQVLRQAVYCQRNIGQGPAASLRIYRPEYPEPLAFRTMVLIRIFQARQIRIATKLAIE